MKKVIITGGGTGGHIYPLLPIIKELNNRKVEVVYVGSGAKVEKEALSKVKIKYYQIFSGKLRRYFDLQNFWDFFKFLFGIAQSKIIVMREWPDAIFTKGGYVGLPVALAGWLFGRKVYLHETDARLGLANKIASFFSKKIFVGFPVENYDQKLKNKMVFTGNPVREEFRNKTNKKIFHNNKKTILVFGGSQGARFINRIIVDIASELTKEFNLIHICGSGEYEKLSQNNFRDYKLFSYVSDMPEILSACDIVVTRSGGSVFEVAASGKPAILIPLPSAANDHQEANAKIFEKAGAAVVLREKDLNGNKILEEIRRIITDKNEVNNLIEKIKKFDKKDTIVKIVNEILK